MKARRLYQFSVSHYCEKARWVLDYKRVDYEVIELFPGLHRKKLRRLGVPGSVPVYVDASGATPTVLGDSMDIALHLERTIADHPILPVDEADRAKVLAIARDLDHGAGPAVRRYMYGKILEANALPSVMFAGASGARLAAGRLAAPLLGALLKKQYKIDRAGMDKSYARVMAAFDGIEQLTGGDPKRYLVGDTLTLADITAASLLGPTVGAAESPWGRTPAPASMIALREELRARPAGRWILERYAVDRP
ncbi:MAG: glutathione S-transferase family protein [Polyangiales bacterium]